MTMAGVRAFRRNRLTTLARLRRVNHAIAHLDEYEAAQLMPSDIRPEVRPPDLGRYVSRQVCK